MSALVDTLLFLDVLRSRVDWPRVSALAFTVALWVTVSLLMARAV